MTVYKLNPDRAKNADSGNPRLTETGAYIGMFTAAKEIESSKGTKGIEFSFKSDSGQTASFQQIWTENNNGEPIFGLDQLNAIMTCLKIKTTTLKDIKIKEYDMDFKKEVDKIVPGFPELMNKKIGIVFQKEEYVSNAGEFKEKVNMYAFFNAETKQTAKEILDQTKAERLEAILATVKDKKLPKKEKQAVEYQRSENQTHAQEINEHADEFDEIPF